MKFIMKYIRDILNILLKLCISIFIYYAGKKSNDTQSQKKIISNINNAKKIEDKNSSLSDNLVRRKLHKYKH